MDIITQTKKKAQHVSASAPQTFLQEDDTKSQMGDSVTLLSLNVTSNQLENPWLCSREGHKFVHSPLPMLLPPILFILAQIKQPQWSLNT